MDNENVNDAEASCVRTKRARTVLWLALLISVFAIELIPYLEETQKDIDIKTLGLSLLINLLKAVFIIGSALLGANIAAFRDKDNDPIRLEVLAVGVGYFLFLISRMGVQVIHIPGIEGGAIVGLLLAAFVAGLGAEKALANWLKEYNRDRST